MTKEEILKEVLLHLEYLSESMTDKEFNEDRGVSINHSRSLLVKMILRMK